MKILILGGTRFIGAAAVRRFMAQGHDVAVLNRGQSPHQPPAGVLCVTGDRDDLASSRRDIAAYAPDVVLHNVVVTEDHARQAVDVLRGIAGRIVMTSSCDVYRAYGRLTGKEPGPPDKTPITEESPLREVSYPYRDQAPDENHILYNYDKIPAENIVLSDSEIEGVVLRLPMVWGPNDYQHRLFSLFKPMTDKRRAIVFSSEYANWRSTYGYVDNVAECMALACVSPKARGIYNVADWDLSTLEQAEEMRKRTGWNGEIVQRPEADLPEALRSGVATSQNLVCSSQKIRDELGYEALHDLSDALDQTLAWELENQPDPVPPGLLNYDEVDALLKSQ